jgi:hypothetical protein
MFGDITVDEKIALYERFLEEFVGEDGKLKPCNPDAIFNWFGNNLHRIFLAKTNQDE